MTTEEIQAQKDKEEAARVFDDSPMEPSDAVPISASDIVSSDTDRPKADNKLDSFVSQPRDIPSAPEAGKKRGRPKLTDEQKAASAAQRANRPPPSFDDLKNSNAPRPGIPLATPTRDYQAEAMQLFVPLSMAAGKWLGDHWGLKIDHDKKQVDLTDEQKNYVYTMGKWLEYEQFPPLNPRWGFVIASAAYIAPKVRTDPTPEKLKVFWDGVKKLWNKIIGKK